MQRRLPLHRSRPDAGYAMLVALILLALLAIIGATSLDIAGVDQRVATHSRRHMMLMNAADAAGQHARAQLMREDPPNEGWDTGDPTRFVDSTESNDNFGGVVFPMNQGTYDVDAAYDKCSNPPPGYSTEVGRTSFHSDYWDMTTNSWFEDASATQMNPTESSVMVTLRKVKQGTCKIR